MDFELTSDQDQVRALAAQVFAAHAGDDAWRELGRAGLCGVAIPEAYGGAGLGFLEVCLVCREAGRAAPATAIPLVAALVSAGGALAEAGTETQRRRWLPALARGEAMLTAALVDVAGLAPVRARRAGAEFRLDGARGCVPAAEVTAALVPAHLDGRTALFLVDPRGGGVDRQPQLAGDGAPLQQWTFDGAAAELLGAPDGAPLLAQIGARTAAAHCAVALGIAEQQLALLSGHAQRRQQFGRPIGAFQAVAQRAADAYIDVDALRLTTWQAVWRIAAGLPAEVELAVARFWAAEAGHRVSAAAQHLHGGIGFDRAYPLHRYYLAQRRVGLLLAAPESLAELGAQLARAD